MAISEEPRDYGPRQQDYEQTEIEIGTERDRARKENDSRQQASGDFLGFARPLFRGCEQVHLFINKRFATSPFPLN